MSHALEFSSVRFHEHDYDEDPDYLEGYDYWLLQEIEHYNKTGKLDSEWERTHEKYVYVPNNVHARYLNTPFDDE